MTLNPTGAVIDCAGVVLDLRIPRVMGVLNVTPDSFSDGGQLYRDQKVDADALLRRADAMVTGGASILDVGGESTRPGAAQVAEDEELERVASAIELLRSRFDVALSLDTSSASVMRAGAALGAHMINDVRALRREGALKAAADSGLPVVLMHMQGQPQSMQQAPAYSDVVDEVRCFLLERIAACEKAGISRGKILLDPGFGFGKTPQHNFALLKRLPEIVALNMPVLVGLSRKSMIASVIDRAPDERLAASLALATIAAVNGARIVRVHDVAETYDALAMLQAMEAVPQ